MQGKKHIISCPCLPSHRSAPDCGTNPGWRKDNGICYYYNDTDIVDFHTALARCYDEHSTLVSILSKDEQAYVNSMVRLFFFYFFAVEKVAICFSEICLFHSFRWERAGWLKLGLEWGCMASQMDSTSTCAVKWLELRLVSDEVHGLR